MFVTPDTDHIVVPWHAALAQLIPSARTFNYDGQQMLAIPNGHDEAKIARNLGIPVPAPIITKYDWPHHPGKTPWATQKTTAALLTESPRGYVLSMMGTGKTSAAAWAADYLLRAGVVQRVLISCSLSTITPVWEKELFELFPRASVKVLYGDRAKRLKLLAEDAEWYVINHHGVEMLTDDLATRGFGVFVIDELASRGLRTKGTGLWKAHTTVVNAPSVKYAWGLTGSPTPKAPTDAWAQIRMLTPDRTTKTLGRFKDMTMRQISNFKWISRPEAVDIVHNTMQPSVRFTLDDVQELPPTVYTNRDVKLEPETAKAYKLLFDKMAMLTRQGENITAVNEGVLQMKLMQVACGYIYTDKHTVYKLPNGNRLAALVDLIEEADRKVIVFVPFVHALNGVSAHLKTLGYSTELVYGGTPKGARDRIFRAFQEKETPRILVVHPDCCAHGLTLTAANTVVWYCPTNGLDTYEQANARIVRPSQTSKTLIAHLVGTPVERATYARLRERAKLQGMLLELFKNQGVSY